MYVFERTDGQATPDGPNGDVSGVGSYIYLASSEESNGNGTARLLSPVASSDMGTVCFEFWYYMNGEHVDNLQILLETGTDAQSLWQRKSEQGMKWIFGEVTLDLQKGQRLVTQASLITESKGVIALDDFIVKAGACPARHTCDFEDHLMCNWQQDPEAPNDWYLVRGSDLVPNAPGYDHTYQTSYGSFLYAGYNSTEGSSYDIARILSPEYKLHSSSPSGCLQLWAYSYGSNPVSFLISLIPTSNGLDLTNQKKQLFSMQYSDSGTWRRLSTQLEHSGTFRIAIEASGDFKNGAISIDDIDVNVWRSCETPATCNFNDGQCGWQNDWYNFYDWAQHHGATASPGTGPAVDHTIGTAAGGYMYLESSASFVPTWAKESVLESEFLSPYNYYEYNDKACFRFYYHMYGHGMGELKVELAHNKKVYWSIKGDQGNEWHRALVEIDTIPPEPIIVRLRGIIGTIGQSDIAVDDTALLPGTCSQYNETILPHLHFNCSRPRPDGEQTISATQICDFIVDCPDGEDELDCGFSCDFDSAPEGCAWAPLFDKFSDQMWKWGKGSDNETNNFGPDRDHTTNSTDGGYQYIAVNPTGTQNEHGDLFIHLRPTAENCRLAFYYQITAPNQLSTSWGHIDIGIGLGDSRIETARYYGNTMDDDWQYVNYTIGRIHTDFTVISCQSFTFDCHIMFKFTAFGERPQKVFIDGYHGHRRH